MLDMDMKKGDRIAIMLRCRGFIPAGRTSAPTVPGTHPHPTKHAPPHPHTPDVAFDSFFRNSWTMVFDHYKKLAKGWRVREIKYVSRLRQRRSSDRVHVRGAVCAPSTVAPRSP